MKENPVLFAKAIADDTRQKIMSFCCCRWCSVGEITESMEVSQPTVSHHLAILRDAGLVDIRSEGKQTFYMLNQERVALLLRSINAELCAGDQNYGCSKKLSSVTCS